jgi:multiple sugar transport system permease protein
MHSTVETTQAGATTEGVKGYHLRKTVRDRRAFLLFVAPAVFFFALLMLWPLGNMFFLSLVKWRGLVKPKTFVGLANFSRLIADRHIHRALLNTGIHLLVSMPGVMIPGFMLGFFLSLRRPGYRLLRTIYFAPAIVSVTALAMMFVGVYLPDGILNTFLRAVGLDNWTRVWLGNRSTVLLAIIAIDLYSGIGYYAVLFSAALSGVPAELYESARLDGAGQWTIMWRIAFPLILGFFGVVTMLHLMWILLGAAQRVLLLTGGGPGDYSLTLGYYMYEQAFSAYQLGYSQAIAVAIFFIGIAGMLIIRLATHRDYME